MTVAGKLPMKGGNKMEEEVEESAFCSFLIGLFLSLLGVIIAYAVGGRTARTCSLWGFALNVVVSIIVIPLLIVNKVI